jgi:hypothetical protein
MLPVLVPVYISHWYKAGIMLLSGIIEGGGVTTFELPNSVNPYLKVFRGRK